MTLVIWSTPVVCLQEARCKGSKIYEFEGHFIILSGAEGDGREYAGVGFFVASGLANPSKDGNKTAETLAFAYGS